MLLFSQRMRQESTEHEVRIPNPRSDVITAYWEQEGQRIKLVPNLRLEFFICIFVSIFISYYSADVLTNIIVII